MILTGWLQLNCRRLLPWQLQHLSLVQKKPSRRPCSKSRRKMACQSSSLAHIEFRTCAMKLEGTGMSTLKGSNSELVRMMLQLRAPNFYSTMTLIASKRSVSDQSKSIWPSIMVKWDPYELTHPVTDNSRSENWWALALFERSKSRRGTWISLQGIGSALQLPAVPGPPPIWRLVWVALMSVSTRRRRHHWWGKITMLTARLKHCSLKLHLESLTEQKMLVLRAALLRRTSASVRRVGRPQAQHT